MSTDNNKDMEVELLPEADIHYPDDEEMTDAVVSRLTVTLPPSPPNVDVTLLLLIHWH
jgi:hypothetical protein